MRVPILVLGLVGAAGLWGQSKFSWQDYCFKHLASPACRGHDFATKPPPKEAAPRTVYKSSFPSTPRSAAPVLTVVGGLDWRFADPSADVLAGFNLEGLAASPLAHGLVADLGARQGLSAADIEKLFDGLSGVDHVALSLTNARGGGERAIVMVTGRVTDLQLPAPEAGMKAVTVSSSALLMGNAAAVDEAARRIAAKWPLGDLARRAEELEANSEFWAVGPASIVGPDAVAAGMKRFSIAVSLRDRLTTDVSFEFNGAPNANTIQALQTKLGAAAVEGNTIHIRMSLEADEARQKFGEIAASPLGERLADLVKAARSLPARDTTVPKQTKPVIYGLDDGPRIVNQ